MKKAFLILLGIVNLNFVKAQNVGIGTTTPLARLHVIDSSVVFSATAGVPVTQGDPPISGVGRRMMWYADKAAFRVGIVSGANWNKDSIGLYSFGAGINSKAKGGGSTAIGFSTVAIGDGSTAMGGYTVCKSVAGTAIGIYNDISDAPSPTLDALSDRIFQIGNGKTEATRSNAITVLRNGNTGIGTIVPAARLHVVDSNVVFSATSIAPLTQGDPPISGEGRRMMWYADKAAFRAGCVYGTFDTYWDKDSIGNYSFAAGLNTKAIGQAAVAIGAGSIAGEQAAAIGSYDTAKGFGSSAIGYFASSSGDYSAAIGTNVIAGGYASTAMGYNTKASGIYCTAMGKNTIASGDYSTAMGNYVKTNGKQGSFIIGDDGSSRSYATYYNDVPNQMQMVFAGGYVLYTGTSSTGIQLQPGQNSWSALSDSRKKEKVLPVNGEEFLSKIAQFKLGTWNYKGQDTKTFRHYGPMAQDFYSAFGKDQLGNIGCDTLINQQDFLGVNLIAIQALEKRTTVLNTDNAKLKMQNEGQAKRLEELGMKNEQLQREVAELKTTLQKENGELKQQLAQMQKQMQDIRQLMQAGIIQSSVATVK